MRRARKRKKAWSRLVPLVWNPTVLALVSLGACSSPTPDVRIAETPPDAASFPPVAAMLIQACGTLDCHGQVGRNLRLYGDTGLRLSPLDVPSTLIPTTSNEVTADFQSLIGLEPEVMTAVVTSQGANPERLLFIRKARGTESHKGGTVMVAGDPRDACLTSWLRDQLDADACKAALALP